MTTSTADQELKIDPGLLAEIVRQRVRILMTLGGVFFVGLLIAGLFVIHQSFTASVSLVIERPGPSAAGLLTGLIGRSTSTNYIGVIRSRRFAQKVDRAVDIRSFYHLSHNQEDDRKATDKLMESVRVQDLDAEGLLFIHITLEGPPRFGPGAAPQRARAKELARQVANAYADTLRDYMQTTDVNRESVLLRTADENIAQARQDYEIALTHLTDFIREKHASGGSVPTLDIDANAASKSSAPTDPGALVTAATSLQTLYLRRSEIEQELRSALVSQQRTIALLNSQLNDPAQLPEDDPFLKPARTSVNRARLTLQNLQITLADTAPEVVEAKRRLMIAEANLKDQLKAYRSGLTTEQGQTEIKIAAQRSRLTTVESQISAAESKYKLSRDRSTELERLRNEVTIKFEIWRKLATEAAGLSLQAVSGKNRLAVIDTALPPLTGQPGLTMVVILSLFGGLAAPAFMVAFEYLRHSWRRLHAN